jgi:hypothetical protein
VTSGAWRLKDHAEFRTTYIREDIPLDERRKNTFDRLRGKAIRDDHAVSVSDDNNLLIIDGSAVVSLHNGYVKPDTPNHDNGGQ